MADTDDPKRIAAGELRKRLDLLHSAGVEWLGESTPLPEVEQLSLFAAEQPLEPADPIEERRTALEVLAERVSTCTRCLELVTSRTRTVFGVGPLDPDLCFVGEAPGADEDRQGEPFVGAAGQMLNRIIQASGLKREDVFICNILRCRPPGNRQPKPDEALHCREYLDGTLALVRPKFICALGATATSNLLGVKTPLGKLRGKFHDYRGIPVLCTYHPAALLEGRMPEKKKDVWDDMKLLLAKMGKPIPKGGKQG